MAHTCPQLLAAPPSRAPACRGNVYDALVANFDEAYNGNRAPFPVFIHTPWCVVLHCPARLALPRPSQHLACRPGAAPYERESVPSC